jgi:hypothetical protein
MFHVVLRGCAEHLHKQCMLPCLVGISVTGTQCCCSAMPLWPLQVKECDCQGWFHLAVCTCRVAVAGMAKPFVESRPITGVCDACVHAHVVFTLVTSLSTQWVIPGRCGATDLACTVEHCIRVWSAPSPKLMCSVQGPQEAIHINMVTNTVLFRIKPLSCSTSPRASWVKRLSQGIGCTAMLLEL